MLRMGLPTDLGTRWFMPRTGLQNQGKRRFRKGLPNDLGTRKFRRTMVFVLLARETKSPHQKSDNHEILLRRSLTRPK